MDASLGTRIANHTDRLARSFAGAGVGLRPLSADRQTALMTHATIAFNALQPFQVHTDFAAKIALDHVFAILDGMNNLRKLRLSQILGAQARINLRMRENVLRVARSDAINVTQSNVDSLLGRYFYADDTSHKI